MPNSSKGSFLSEEGWKKKETKEKLSLKKRYIKFSQWECQNYPSYSFAFSDNLTIILQQEDTYS